MENDNDKVPQLFLYPREIAQLLGITVQGVHKILKEHDIDVAKIGSRKQMVYPASFKKILELKSITYPNYVIGIHNIKGGVGKTTLVHALGSRASTFGFRTLLVDLDQQANLSVSFGIYPKVGEDPTLLAAYEGQFKGKPIVLKDTIRKITDFLHIIPSNLSLSQLDLALATNTENIGTLFSHLFEPIKNDYDLIFLDCPPALTKLTAAVHCFSNKLILPVNTDLFSLEGLDLTIRHLKDMKKKFRIDPEINVVVNKYDHRHKKIGLEILADLSENYGEYLCERFVAVTKEIENSIVNHECVWMSNIAKNNALIDMNQLLIDILNLEVWVEDWKQKKYCKGLESKHSRDTEITVDA